MDPEAIRAFAGRDRARVEAAKLEHHARRFRESGGVAGIQAGQALWSHARRVRPEWPTQRDREDDLAHHIDLNRRIERAAHAFPRS